MKFYKAKLLQIKLLSRPSRFMYWRLANASQVFFLWFDISWRRSWLPQAAYAQGWDAAFRQFHGIGEAVEQPRAVDVATDDEATTLAYTKFVSGQTDHLDPPHH